MQRRLARHPSPPTASTANSACRYNSSIWEPKSTSVCATCTASRSKRWCHSIPRGQTRLMPTAGPTLPDFCSVFTSGRRCHTPAPTYLPFRPFSTSHCINFTPLCTPQYILRPHVTGLSRAARARVPCCLDPRPVTSAATLPRARAGLQWAELVSYAMIPAACLLWLKHFLSLPHAYCRRTARSVAKCTVNRFHCEGFEKTDCEHDCETKKVLLVEIRVHF